MDLQPDGPPLPLAALLLAGGHGRRAGGPKALKHHHGQPLWCWQVAQLRALGCAPVVAVLHPDAWPLADTAVVAVRSEPDAPQLASLQAGLAAVPPGMAVLLLPVDCPCPPPALVQSLWAAARAAQRRGEAWRAVRPVVETAAGWRAGHPVVLAAAWRAQLLALDPLCNRLDWLLAALPDRQRLDIVTRDVAVLANFNADGISR